MLDMALQSSPEVAAPAPVPDCVAAADATADPAVDNVAVATSVDYNAAVATVLVVH